MKLIQFVLLAALLGTLQTAYADGKGDCPYRNQSVNITTPSYSKSLAKVNYTLKRYGQVVKPAGQGDGTATR